MVLSLSKKDKRTQRIDFFVSKPPILTIFSALSPSDCYFPRATFSPHRILKTALGFSNKNKNKAVLSDTFTLSKQNTLMEKTVPQS
jgi:hypothetical protein